MITCGGCGREIDTARMEYGIRFLCARCCHRQITGPKPPRVLGHTAFTVIAYLCLAALALAGSALCVLYLSGAGNLTWFIVLGLFSLLAAGCPAVILLRRRNLALLIASLYIPLGLWAYLWRLAPGVEWELSGVTAYGAFFFFTTGLVATILFVRDKRALPRI
jgi:hypothetical protein